MRISHVRAFCSPLASVALFILTLTLALEARRVWAATELAPMLLEVDAREVSRKLIHARMEIPVQPGKLALWYPKWLPGNHSPAGPIENIGGLRLETLAGKSVPWRRDETDVFRIETKVPEGVDRIVVKLDYICNPPTTGAMGNACYANESLALISWIACLLYPEGKKLDELPVKTTLLIPEKWRFGSALTVTSQAEDRIEFDTETLRDLVDCPLICGANVRSIQLKTQTGPPVFMHLTSESPSALQLDDNALDAYANVANQAMALFGGAHFTSYHWLVICSDEVPRMGLEHLSSSINALKERDLIDDKKRQGYRTAGLLPHEFAHSWCGKHRRPAGMLTSDLHTPQQTSLLWVYEGLTTYLGDILTVRSGLMTTNQYLPVLAMTVDELMIIHGRQWRSLEDTAISSYLLRAPSPNWSLLRRSQDYYEEGLLLWLEADTIIRQQSDGRRSLDDFCKEFMGAQRGSKIVAYDRAEIIDALQKVAKYDWENFLHERVDVPQETLPLSVIERCGYRLQYAPKPSEFAQEVEREFKFIGESSSIGAFFAESGEVWGVVPGMAAAKAGLDAGMAIQAVNGRKFSRQRLTDAIAESVTRRQIEFLVLEGQAFRTIKVPYADGPKHLELVRDPAKPDLLMSILKPISIKTQTADQKGDRAER